MILIAPPTKKSRSGFKCRMTRLRILCVVLFTGTHTAACSHFWIFFYKTVDKIHKECKRCVFMGDFNVNLLNSDSHTRNRLASFTACIKQICPSCF